jgi:putative FmdB family regulatory protein
LTIRTSIVSFRTLRMPLYEFRCPSGHDFEKFYRSIGSAPSEEKCPECGQVAARLMSPAGLVFKGSGFYITDYGKDGKKDQRTAGAASKPSTESKADAAAPASTSSGGDASASATPSGTTKSAEPASPKPAPAPAPAPSKKSE